MNKQVTLKYFEVGMIVLFFGLIVFLLTRKFSKSATAAAVAADAKTCECGAEWVIRTAALKNQSAKQLYQDIYKTPAVSGKSALSTCAA